jgi:hypothetical protein
VGLEWSGRQTLLLCTSGLMLLKDLSDLSARVGVAALGLMLLPMFMVSFLFRFSWRNEFILDSFDMDAI